MQLKLYYPVRPFGVNQGFGVNGAYYQKNGINIKGHNGIDMRATHGQPVLAAHDGTAFFETDDQQGEGVVLLSNEQFDYKGTQCNMKTIYWHLCDAQKEPKFKSPVLDYQQKHKGTGMPIKRGDVIGYADSTGFSTGDHLHFGLKPIVSGVAHNIIDATDSGIGDWKNLEPTNGYLGAIDPMPYFCGKYADEPDLPPLEPQDAVAVLAATEEAKGNKTLADKLWALVAIIKAFLTKN